MDRGRIEGLSKFFEYPLLSQERERIKLRTSNFVRTIDRNKSPLQISGKVAGAFARTLETFHGTHILGASCGRLCDSKAFLLAFVFYVQSSTVYKTCINGLTLVVIYWMFSCTISHP